MCKIAIYPKKIRIDGHSSCVPRRCAYFLYFGLTLQIPYGLIKMKSNRHTTNPFVSPSLSIHRIEINYEKYKTIQISPKDRQAFVEALQQKNPYIHLDH